MLVLSLALSMFLYIILFRSVPLGCLKGINMNIATARIVFDSRNYFLLIFGTLRFCLYHMFSICHISTPAKRNEVVMSLLLHDFVPLYMQIQIPVF